jgi:hypothetical protein
MVMKKLVGLFLWFCAATVMAQVCVIGLAAYKGNVKRQTIAQIIGLLNGIDVQAERMKQALISARDTPTPTYEEILAAKTNAVLQLDSRIGSIDNLQRQLADQQRQLQARTAEFEERRLKFEARVEQLAKGSQLDSLKEIQTFLENMSPEEAKKQLIIKQKNKELEDVVAILRAMAPDKQKKILAEYSAPGDEELLADILRDIRRGQTRGTEPDSKSP